MSVFDWDTTAGNNGDSDSNINFAEGQAPSTVNDSARALMARVAHWLNMLGSNVTQGGASNAYTFTTGEALSAYSAGMRFLWQPNADSTGAVTLNVDGIGAKKVYMPDGTQAGSGELDADSLYDVVYDASLDTSSGGFKIVGFPDTTLAGGDYLTVANNLSDLGSASTARSNLGLGTAATQATSAFLQPSNNLSDVSSASTARSNIAAYGSGDNVSFGTVTASGAVKGQADYTSGVTGTLVPADHYKGTINNVTGTVTFASSDGSGDHGVLVAGSTAKTINKGTTTMYVNGSSVSTATLAARGIAGFIFIGANTVYVTGDVS